MVRISIEMNHWSHKRNLEWWVTLFIGAEFKCYQYLPPATFWPRFPSGKGSTLEKENYGFFQILGEPDSF